MKDLLSTLHGKTAKLQKAQTTPFLYLLMIRSKKRPESFKTCLADSLGCRIQVLKRRTIDVFFNTRRYNSNCPLTKYSYLFSTYKMKKSLVTNLPKSGIWRPRPQAYPAREGLRNLTIKYLLRYIKKMNNYNNNLRLFTRLLIVYATNVAKEQPKELHNSTGE